MITASHQHTIGGGILQLIFPPYVTNYQPYPRSKIKAKHWVDHFYRRHDKKYIFYKI